MALPGLWANLGQLGLWQFVGLEYIKFVLLYLLRLGCVKLAVNIMARRCRHDKTGGLGQSGHRSKQVIFNRVNQVAGRVGSQVELSLFVFFKHFFFFFGK